MRRQLPTLGRRRALLVALLVLWSAVAAAFPVEIEHRWGTTRIEEAPRRVVSLSYIGGDFLLALGIEPAAIRYWYGGNEKGVWPWVEDAIGDAAPAILRGEIDVERIAMLRPDLIEALWSGITEDEYRRLSMIAPVIAPATEFGDYGTPWPVMLRTIGRATGREEQAEAMAGALVDRMAAIRRAHPGWEGRTAVVGWPGGPGLYTGGDVRVRLLEHLGFRSPEALERIARGGFYVTVSGELTAPYDADVVVWLDGGAAQLDTIALRKTTRAYAEGREILADHMLSAAMSYSSPLSLDYALDRLVPLIEAAIDGDPTTKAGPDGTAAAPR